MAAKFDITGFLEEYQKHPCLWDKTIHEYRNRIKCDYAEKCLLQVSNMAGIKELKRKIRNIRCRYNQEKAKIKSSMKIGSSSSVMYKPKLVWFSLADSFLQKNFDVDNKSRANLILNGESVASTSMENNDEFQIQQNSIEEHINSNSEFKEHENNFKELKYTAQKFKGKISKNYKVDDSLDKGVKTAKKVHKSKLKENEFTIFGRHIITQKTSFKSSFIGTIRYSMSFDTSSHPFH